MNRKGEGEWFIVGLVLGGAFMLWVLYVQPDSAAEFGRCINTCHNNTGLAGNFSFNRSCITKFENNNNTHKCTVYDNTALADYCSKQCLTNQT